MSRETTTTAFPRTPEGVGFLRETSVMPRTLRLTDTGRKALTEYEQQTCDVATGESNDH